MFSINFRCKISGNFRLRRAVFIPDTPFPEKFRLKQATFYLSASIGLDGVLPSVLSAVVVMMVVQMGDGVGKGWINLVCVCVGVCGCGCSLSEEDFSAVLMI